MAVPEPIMLKHSWPSFDQRSHFELGHILNSAVIDVLEPKAIGSVDVHHAGCWECDLSDNSLTWSGGVYDIFGLPRGTHLSRDDLVSFYGEESRAKMERLRAYAIKHRRRFTLDVEIRAAVGEIRRMRIIAAPICDGPRAVRLHGLKLIV